jgi:hypothetical protein
MESVDAGILKLGVESPWAHDNMVVSGAEQSESIVAEPPTNKSIDLPRSGLLATEPVLRVLDAPPIVELLLAINEGNKSNGSPENSKGLGSLDMSISPL